MINLSQIIASLHHYITTSLSERTKRMSTSSKFIGMLILSPKNRYNTNHVTHKTASSNTHEECVQEVWKMFLSECVGDFSYFLETTHKLLPKKISNVYYDKKENRVICQDNTLLIENLKKVVLKKSELDCLLKYFYEEDYNYELKMIEM